MTPWPCTMTWRGDSGQGTIGLGKSLDNQTLLQYLLGEMPQAITSARRAEALLAALPPAYESRLALANARNSSACSISPSVSADGMRKTEEAVALYQALARERPSDQEVRFQQALATTNLGNFVMGSEPDVAVARYREALALLAALRKDAPANPRYTEWEARVTSHIGLILTEAGKAEAAVATQRQAVAAAGQISDEFLRLDALATGRINWARPWNRPSVPPTPRPSSARHSRTTGR